MVKPLQNETKLHCGNRTIVLEEKIGFGGNSIIYAAKIEGAVGRYAVKEAVKPNESALVRDGLLIRAATKDAEELLDKIRKSVENECAAGRSIRDDTLRALAAQEKLTVDRIVYGNDCVYRKEGETNGPGGATFALMERFEKQGDFLPELLSERKRLGKNLSFYEIVKIVLRTAEILGVFHNASNMLYGDLNVRNVFVERSSNPKDTIGQVYLIDFGCARSISPETGETDEIDPSSLFSTEQYRAPEIDGVFVGTVQRLTAAVDVFSLGALLLDLVGALPKTPELSLYLFRIDDALKTRGATPAAILKCKEFLRSCMAPDVHDRININEAIELLNELEKICRPPEYLLNPNLASTPGMYEVVLKNRKKDLEWLDREIQKEDPVIIFGMGGVGKTELALAFAKSRFPGRAYRVTFQRNLKDTVKHMHFSGFDDSSYDDESLLYEKKMDILREQYTEDQLLILDNFDSQNKTLEDLQDEVYYDLANLRMKLLVTTRSDPDSAQKTSELQPPSVESMMEYFESIVGPAKDTHELEKRRQLIELVECHPLTVELAARSCVAKFQPVSVDNLLAEFSNLKRAKLPRIKSEKDNKHRKDTIYGHLKLLFSMARLTRAEKDVLSHASLLFEEGLDADLFYECEGAAEREALERLENRRLLRCSEDRMISLHPLIREVVVGELKISERTDRRFLDGVWENRAIDQDDAVFIIYLAAAERYPKSKVYAERLYEMMGGEDLDAKLKKAGVEKSDFLFVLPFFKRFYERTMEATIEIDGKEFFVGKGMTFNRNTYYVLTDTNDATHIMYRKLKIEDGEGYYTGLDSKEEVELVTQYASIDLLEMYLQNGGEADADYVADAYAKLAFAFDAVDNHAEAAIYLEKAEAYLKKRGDEKYGAGLFLSLSRFYYGIAEHYRDNGSPHLCRQYILRNHFLNEQRSIREQKENQNGDHARSEPARPEPYVASQEYRENVHDGLLMAKAYLNAGEFERAIEYYERAERCLCQVFFFENLGRVNHEMSTAYRGLGEREEELACIKAAIICYEAEENWSRKTFSDEIAKLNVLAADALLSLDRLDEASGYVQIAEELCRSAPGIQLRTQVGLLYTASRVQYALKNYDQGIALLNNMLRLAEENPSQLGNLDQARIYTEIALGYGELGKYELSLEYLLKALRLREKRGDPGSAAIYWGVGIQYDYLDQPEQALEYYLKALALREKTQPQDAQEIAENSYRIGYTYHKLGDHEAALKYLLRAKMIWEQIQPLNKRSLRSCYAAIGFSYDALEEHDKAEMFFELARMTDDNDPDA